MQGRDIIPVLAMPEARRDVHQFALQVVSRLARTSEVQSGRASPEILEIVLRLARTGDPVALARLQSEMRRRRLSGEQVIDIYFPAAIEVIGTDWHQARIDILEATVATARLQSLLRELSRACLADRAQTGVGGLVLMLVPPGEQHSFGAILAVHQLRRQGVSVKMAFMSSLASLEPLVRDKSYDAVFMSVSNESAVSSARLVCRDLRARLSNQVPIVLGGGLVSRANCANDTARLVALTGVDLATCDLNVALQGCVMNRVSVAAE